MRCIAIDDERLVLDLLIDNIQKVPYLNLAKAFKDPIQAFEFLKHDQVDLIFLDIQMPQINGLQFLKTLYHPPMVILVTAYEQFALEGYDLDVVDYLLKPVSFERFLKACDKAYKLHKLRLENKSGELLGDYFFVNVEYKSVKVFFSEIIFIEGLKDYIKIHVTTQGRPILTKLSMKAIEEKLKPHQFIRIHKSYIINISKVTCVKRDFITVEQKDIPIGDTYKENTIQILKG